MGYFKHSGATQTFADTFTFARASSATYVDSSGNIQTATSGTARQAHHRYDGAAWVKKGLLLESEARTNLVTHSEDFTNAAWVKTNATVTGDAAASPDGTTNADKLVEDSSTGQHYVDDQSLSVTSGTSYAASVFAKADERGFLVISLFQSVPTNEVWFNLTSGAVGTVSGTATASIEDFGGGWYRCSVIVTANATGSNTRFFIKLADADNSNSYAGDGSSGLLIYGAQLEAVTAANPYPSSYIPTSGATVTRAAETLSVAAANMPDYQTPNVIGAELVTNGTFDTDTSGWVAEANAAVSWSSGRVRVERTDASNFPRASQFITGLTVGKAYRLTGDVFISGGVRCGINISGISNNYRTSDGSIDAIFVAPSISAALQVVIEGNGGSVGFSFEADNISVREIDPLAVCIAMKGEVSYGDAGSNAQVIFVDWNTGSEYIIHRLSTASDRIGQALFLQLDNSTLDSVQSVSDQYSPGQNVAFSIAGRHGSTFVNGAVDGTALTANTTPTSLADLSTADFDIGTPFNGTIEQILVWNEDIGDTGIEEATS